MFLCSWPAEQITSIALRERTYRGNWTKSGSSSAGHNISSAQRWWCTLLSPQFGRVVLLIRALLLQQHTLHYLVRLVLALLGAFRGSVLSHCASLCTDIGSSFQNPAVRSGSESTPYFFRGGTVEPQRGTVNRIRKQTSFLPTETNCILPAMVLKYHIIRI